MPRMLNDPLLLVARLLVTMLLFLFALGFIAGLSALVALPFPYVQRQIADLPLQAGVTTADFAWRILVMLALVLVFLAAAFLFTLYLRRIIDTVSAGDPFTSLNADRLRWMGWLMMLMPFIASAIPVIVGWINELVREAPVHDAYDLSIEGLLLALVLFILARVFRHGTALRDDVEGTV